MGAFNPLDDLRKRVDSLRRELDELARREVPGGFVGARVYNNANLSIGDASATALTFNSERYDTDSLHDTGGNTGRLTAPVAGKYSIIGHVGFDANTTGSRIVLIRLNGTTTIAQNTSLPMTAGLYTFFNLATEYTLAANDYVELLVYQNSGGALNVIYEANYSPEFMMSLISS